jgi:hypothetical protein
MNPALLIDGQDSTSACDVQGMTRNPESEQERYSEEQAGRRFEATLRAALTTPPKHLKDVPRRRPKTKRKANKAAKPSS